LSRSSFVSTRQSFFTQYAIPPAISAVNSCTLPLISSGQIRSQSASLIVTSGKSFSYGATNDLYCSPLNEPAFKSNFSVSSNSFSLICARLLFIIRHSFYSLYLLKSITIIIAKNTNFYLFFVIYVLLYLYLIK